MRTYCTVLVFLPPLEATIIISLPSLTLSFGIWNTRRPPSPPFFPRSLQDIACSKPPSLSLIYEHDAFSGFWREASHKPPRLLPGWLAVCPARFGTAHPQPRAEQRAVYNQGPFSLLLLLLVRYESCCCCRLSWCWLFAKALGYRVVCADKQSRHERENEALTS